MENLNLGIDAEGIKDFVVYYGIQVILALVVLVLGLWIIKMITNSISKLFDKRGIDPSLRPFLRGIISISLKIMLIISIMSMVGIEMVSFIAVLGAIGLAIGMALSGTLQNFAGGVIILILKPYRVGDYIGAQGHGGTVKEIGIFNTVLKTPDNVTIIIPNGSLSNSSVTNYSMEDLRRVDFVFGIGYSDDIDKVRGVIKGLIDEDARSLKEPEPMIVISELADSSVNFTVRIWVKAPDYWSYYFDMHEKVKKSFDASGVSIPFPQTDVHLYQQSN